MVNTINKESNVMEYVLTPQEEELVKEGQVVIDKNKEKISAEWYELVKNTKGQMKNSETRIKETAMMLLRDGLTGPEARVITVAQFIEHLSYRRIRALLPIECKDRLQVERAIAGNKTKAERKQADIEKARVEKEEVEKKIEAVKIEQEVKKRVPEAIKAQGPMMVPVKPGIFTSMLEIVCKRKIEFQLAIDPIQHTLIDVIAAEETESEPAAPRPR